MARAEAEDRAWTTQKDIMALEVGDMGVAVAWELAVKVFVKQRESRR
jgi:hypothetical protein